MTGAGEDFWESERLPGVFKHTLLAKYLPKFGGKTGSRSGRVVFLDGYAGRGRHADGSPGSAELMLRSAAGQVKAGVSWECFFSEKDATSFASLEKVVAEYSDRVQVDCRKTDVDLMLDDVLQASGGAPLFLFLDPCGLGLPFARLADALNSRPRHPPTEVLLNLSMDAIRRIGGHLNSPVGSDRVVRSLDEAMGGSWWQQELQISGADAVADEFARRLSRECRMTVQWMPVRRALSNKPLYYLVFGTRSMHGIYEMSDAAALAGQAWRDGEARTHDDPGALFGAAPVTTLDQLGRDALPEVKGNIVALLQQHERFVVVEHVHELLGDHLGEVRNLVIRTAVKELHAEGITACDGRGEIARMVVTRP